MFLKFFKANENLLDEVYRLNNEADSNRLLHYNSAVKIQAAFRGHAIRKWLSTHNHHATVIQSFYRGHRQRRLFRKMVAKKVKSDRENYYHKMATKIQALFRGFLVRKNKHNFYARKRYLEIIKLQNEIVIEHLSNLKMQQDEVKARQTAEKEKTKIIYNARKNHYLLSTHQKSGVYDPRRPNGRVREPMEKMLRVVKPLGSFERKKKLPDIGLTHADDVTPNLSRKSTITRQPQGPFKKNREDIIEQRFRELNPSLRVSEAYDFSIQEARQQLKFDNMAKCLRGPPFQFMKVSQEPYQPRLHTTSDYRHIDYGNKHFRAFEEKKSTQDDSRFANVVSPIPFFDKYMADRERKYGPKISP